MVAFFTLLETTPIGFQFTHKMVTSILIYLSKWSFALARSLARSLMVFTVRARTKRPSKPLRQIAFERQSPHCLFPFGCAKLSSLIKVSLTLWLLGWTQFATISLSVLGFSLRFWLSSAIYRTSHQKANLLVADARSPQFEWSRKSRWRFATKQTAFKILDFLVFLFQIVCFHA